MNNYMIYIAVLCVYLPGIYWIFSRNLIIRTPIIAIFMLTSFIFVGLGAFYPLSSMNITGAPLISLPYVVMLFIQPMIFYILYLVPPFSQMTSINWKSKILVIPLSRHIRIISFLWLLSLLIIAQSLYNDGLPFGYNLENWLTDATFIRNLRQETPSGSSKFWIIQEGFYHLPILASVYLFIVWKYSKRKKILFFVYSSFLLAAILSFSFLYKEYLFILVVFTMYAAFLIKNEFKVTNAVLIVIVAVLLLGMFFYIYTPGLGLDFYFALLSERIISPYSVSMAFVSKFMAESGNYLGGTTLINPLGILPFEHYRLDLFVHESLFAGLSGSVPVPFLGEGYANFSWLGIFVFWLLALFSLSLLSYLARSIKDRISATFFVLFVIYYTYKFSFCTIHEMINHLIILKIFLLYLFLNYRFILYRSKDDCLALAPTQMLD